MKQPRREWVWAFRACVCALIFFSGARELEAASQSFGDITVRSLRMANGQTYHGYCEHRFHIDNASATDDYVITIELPNGGGRGSGNSLRRLSRSVKVSANSSARMPIFQMALPIYGGREGAVYVDGDYAGAISLGGGFDHVPRYFGGAPAHIILTSRGIDTTGLDSKLQRSVGGGRGGDYSAQRATGKPNASGSNRYHREAWVPNSGRRPEWLELIYSKPNIATAVDVHFYGRRDALVRIDLLDKRNRRLTTITNNSTRGSTGTFTSETLKFTATTQAVARVRLYLDSTRKGEFSVDAAALVGPKSRQWATSGRASSEYRGSRSSGAIEYPKPLESQFEIDAWSDDWLSYTPFDMVLLHAHELERAAPAVREALWRYAEGGGTLGILGEAEIPKAWQANSSENADFTAYRVGFGTCITFDSVRVNEFTSADLRKIKTATRHTAQPWSTFGDASAANDRFPVVDNLDIPVRGVTFIMLVFIVIVGPLNVYVLAKMNRRIWMLWTIPAISLVTCGIIFTYSLLSDGITPSTRVEGITLIDHHTRRATTLGTLAFYCPLTPSGGLKFGFDTEVFPMVSNGNSRNNRGTARTVQWGDGQHLQDGWISARMPAHFAVRKSETRRERVELKLESGEWTAVNGLGSDISSLGFNDSEGNLWRSGPIAAGQQAILEKSGEQKPASEFLRDIYMSAKWFAMDELKLSPWSGLPQNTYAAVLKDTPFVDSGFRHKGDDLRSSIVIGYPTKEELAP
jgi:hypothetical protein